MKNLYKIVKVMLILALWGLWSSSYAQTNTDSLLCRSWQVDWQATYQAASVENQAKFLALTPAQQTYIEQMLSAQRYVFESAGTLLIEGINEGTPYQHHLVWQRAEMLLTLSVLGQHKQTKIKFLDTNQLILEALNSAELFPVLYLNAQN